MIFLQIIPKCGEHVRHGTSSRFRGEQSLNCLHLLVIVLGAVASFVGADDVIRARERRHLTSIDQALTPLI
ncbi:hypothetical protein Y032_0002g517 [Ancylostoma ceylanicum]|uniref:Uncharacterized protein n=1 Tax=Ancylostoma ceylanicum TaxID=53326 RepID=A0A016VZV2_9BILA|nr:hypothetical protein Y032_0002g517 [Ancylostoma ceylanicum]